MKIFKYLLAFASMLVGTAFAAVPASVTTSLATAEADAVTVAGIVLSVIVAIYAFKLMRKAL